MGDRRKDQGRPEEARAFHWVDQPIHLPSASSPVQDSASILRNSKETETQSQYILAEQMLKRAAMRNLMSQWEPAWKSQADWTHPCRCCASNRRQTQVVCNRDERSKCLALGSACGALHGTKVWKDTDWVWDSWIRVELEFWLHYLSVCSLRQVCPLS